MSFILNPLYHPSCLTLHSLCILHEPANLQHTMIYLCRYITLLQLRREWMLASRAG
jgi:hypothetical protein